MVPWKVKVDAKGNRLKIGLRAIFPWARRWFHISLGLKLTQLPAGAGDDTNKTSFSHRFVKKSKSVLHRVLRKCGISTRKKRDCGASVGEMFGGLRDRIPAKVWRVLGVVSILAVFNCSILHFLFALF